jgi:hypothetical protein
MNRKRFVVGTAGIMNQPVGGSTISASAWHGLRRDIDRGARYFWARRGLPVPINSRDSVFGFYKQGQQ